MIKRTLYFGNPCRLSKKQDQLFFIDGDEKAEKKSIPIEDIGVMVLDNQQIQLTEALLMALMDNNVALITCNWQHLPYGLLLPMHGHHAFTEKVKAQVEASEPLRKNLWQQTVTSKIRNQAVLLDNLGIPTDNMYYWAKQVRSGDPDNFEARAAAYYWENIFMENPDFRRGRYEAPPNNLLNYGYAILRGVLARSLVASGMMTWMGIKHKNKYNAYCLADDIMEPYRPYVDQVVLEMLMKYENIKELTPDIKRELLVIPALDVYIDDNTSPLMVAVQRTTASLMRCYEGIQRKIQYPELRFL